MKHVITFKDVNKLFYLQHQKTLKEAAQALVKKQKTLEKVQALKQLSFTVKKGKTLGILGKNGAGKSTLLKLIAGVSQPTSGSAEIIGRVAPLIELGAGFHPELSGRENVFLNGVILGLKEKDIEKKFKEIIDFAELHDFVDMPVKHYSSGMYTRLAFSVAVSVDPDILLVDEVLSVGDMAFQEKCMEKMRSFKKKGTTIILVTHSTKSVRSFCDVGMFLEKGEMLYYGEPEQAVHIYEEKNSLR